jgi:hypothetical protein
MPADGRETGEAPFDDKWWAEVWAITGPPQGLLARGEEGGGGGAEGPGLEAADDGRGEVVAEGGGAATEQYARESEDAQHSSDGGRPEAGGKRKAGQAADDDIEGTGDEVVSQGANRTEYVEGASESVYEGAAETTSKKTRRGGKQDKRGFWDALKRGEK